MPQLKLKIADMQPKTFATKLVRYHRLNILTRPSRAMTYYTKHNKPQPFRNPKAQSLGQYAYLLGLSLGDLRF